MSAFDFVRRRLVLPAALFCAGVAMAQEVRVVGDPHTSFVSRSSLHRVFLRPNDAMSGVLQSLAVIRHFEDYESFAIAVVDGTTCGGAVGLQAMGCELRDDEALIGFNGAPLDTADEEIALDVLAQIPEKLRADSGAPVDLMIVQFAGPVRDEWLVDLDLTGAERIAYVASNAYVVRADAAAREALARFVKAAPVQWIGPFHPFWRLSPELRTQAIDEAGFSSVTIQVIDGPDAGAMIDVLANGSFPMLAMSQHVGNLTDVNVIVPNAELASLARNSSIFAIEERAAAGLNDEVQGQIVAGNLNVGGTAPAGPGYLAWLASKGINTNVTSGVIIDIADTGIDRGVSLPIHSDFHFGGNVSNGSRVVYNFNYTGDPDARDVHGHGTLDASIAAGYNAGSTAADNDANGYNYGLGICPMARLGNSRIFDATEQLTGTSATTRIAAARAAGARISSNSWGAKNVPPAYNAVSQEHDFLVRDAQASVNGNQQMSIVFAAGNDGFFLTNGGSTVNLVLGSVKPPATAKNIITVGASESVRTNGPSPNGPPNFLANTATDVAWFSSRGPCADGRTKPDLLAPGTDVQGAASQANGYHTGSPWDSYWPPLQTKYTWATGTSQAAPAVAGAAGLVWTRGYPSIWAFYGFLPWVVRPGPALIKNILMTTSKYVSGQIPAGDSLFSNHQGMGRVDLGRAFDATPKRYFEGTRLGATGQTMTYTGTIALSNEPFRVGLVWTDAPGSLTGSAWVNNLDLEVTVNGALYRGNVFSGATSVAGGGADFMNNTEFVCLPAGTTGTYSITVRASNIAGDGVPGNSDATDQDYSLYIYNTIVPPPFALINAVSAPSFGLGFL